MEIIGRFSILSPFRGRSKLSIGEKRIIFSRGDVERFDIKWTQLEKIEMDRKGMFKVISFKCFNRTEIVSTGDFKRKDLKRGYIRLVELAQENMIKVIEVNGW